jgi:hypothetical protein
MNHLGRKSAELSDDRHSEDTTMSLYEGDASSGDPFSPFRAVGQRAPRLLRGLSHKHFTGPIKSVMRGVASLFPAETRTRHPLLATGS